MKIKINKGEQKTLILLLEKEIKVTEAQIKNFKKQNFASEVSKNESISVAEIDLKLFKNLKDKIKNG